MEESDERLLEAELWRLKGALTLEKFQVPDSTFQVKNRRSGSRKPKVKDPQWAEAEAEAEACFHQTIAIARRQEAKLFELRAIVSLARVRQRQGKKEEARQRLAEIYGWFTEGFDTADLQEAKVLLEELRY